MTSAARTWARETFGGIDFGDSRRTSRLVRMASLAADQPSGTVPSVFNDAADQQGAYDFLESEHIGADVLEAGHGAAVAASCERSGQVPAKASAKAAPKPKAAKPVKPKKPKLTRPLGLSNR